MKILKYIKDMKAVEKMEKLQFGVTFIGSKSDINMVREIVKLKSITDKFYVKEVCKEVYNNAKCSKSIYKIK